MICNQPRLLQQARILVAEDNAILAYEMQTLLRDAGAVILGPARTLADTLAFARSAVLSCAVLDVNLRGEAVFPAARVLRERGVSIVFHTGCYTPEGLGQEWQDAQVLIKPAPLDLQMRTICAACGRSLGRKGFALPLMPDHGGDCRFGVACSRCVRRRGM